MSGDERTSAEARTNNQPHSVLVLGERQVFCTAICLMLRSLDYVAHPLVPSWRDGLHADLDQVDALLAAERIHDEDTLSALAPYREQLRGKPVLIIADSAPEREGALLAAGAYAVLRSPVERPGLSQSLKVALAARRDLDDSGRLARV